MHTPSRRISGIALTVAALLLGAINAAVDLQPLLDLITEKSPFGAAVLAFLFRPLVILTLTAFGAVAAVWPDGVADQPRQGAENQAPSPLATLQNTNAPSISISPVFNNNVSVPQSMRTKHESHQTVIYARERVVRAEDEPRVVELGGAGRLVLIYGDNPNSIVMMLTTSSVRTGNVMLPGRTYEHVGVKVSHSNLVDGYTFVDGGRPVTFGPGEKARQTFELNGRTFLVALESVEDLRTTAAAAGDLRFGYKFGVYEQ